jgi:hypothetical protein
LVECELGIIGVIGGSDGQRKGSGFLVTVTATLGAFSVQDVMRCGILDDDAVVLGWNGDGLGCVAVVHFRYRTGSYQYDRMLEEGSTGLGEFAGQANPKYNPKFCLDYHRQAGI